MNSKRINIVCNYAAIYGGNFIPSLVFLCNSISDKVNIIFTFPKEAKGRTWIKYLEDKGYKIFYIENFFSKKSKKDFKKINKDQGINLIYSHFISSLKIKLLYPFTHRIKLKIHIHSDWNGNNAPSFKQRLLSFVDNHFFRTDAEYIYVSQNLYFNSKAKHKYYVPNALCLERIPSSPFNVEDFKYKHGIDDHDTILLFFGWAPYVKGLDVAIKSFLSLPSDKQGNYKFIIIHKRGDGLKTCLNYLIDKLGTDVFMRNKNIIFTEPAEDIFEFYKFSDIFISASRSEGFSYSILEAVYHGLHVFSSNIPGVEWSKQFAAVSFFENQNDGELSNLIIQFNGFKSRHKTNIDVAKKFDISKWCFGISSIIIGNTNEHK